MANDTQVQITIAATLDDSLESATSAAMEQLEELEHSAPQINIADPQKAQEQAAKAAEIARKLADEIAQNDEQLALKQISAAVQANNFELSMGQESVDLWKEYALEEADAKYDAELKYLEKKAAAAKGNAAAEQRDIDQMKVAQQEYYNQLDQINQQYQQKKRQTDQQELQDKIQAENSEYQNTVSKLNAEVSDHQISASQRAQAEIALATTVESQELAMFDATHKNLVQGSAAWNEAAKQRQAIIDAANHRIETANDQLTAEEAQRWTQLSNSIKSSFNTAIDSMLFQGKSFEQGMLTIAQGVLKAFISMAENIAEEWIEGQVKALFLTETTQQTAAATEVSTQAGIAAATAYAQYAAFPPIADAMAAEAFAETMMWGAPKLATGAWELKNDTMAMLHRGEMVVPQNFAAGLRAHGGGFGGDVNMHYAPTINAREPATLSQMLTRESGEMLAWLNRQMRNGSLRAA